MEVTKEQNANISAAALGVVFIYECGISQEDGFSIFNLNREILLESGLSPEYIDVLIDHRVEQFAILANQGFDACDAFREVLLDLKN